MDIRDAIEIFDKLPNKETKLGFKWIVWVATFLSMSRRTRIEIAASEGKIEEIKISLKRDIEDYVKHRGSITSKANIQTNTDSSVSIRKRVQKTVEKSRQTEGSKVSTSNKGVSRNSRSIASSDRN